MSRLPVLLPASVAVTLTVVLSCLVAAGIAQPAPQDDPERFNWAELDAQEVSQISYRTFKWVQGRHLRALPAASCAGLQKAQMDAIFGSNHVTDHPCESFSRECLLHAPKAAVAATPRNCMSRFPAQTLSDLPREVYEWLTSAYLFQVISAEQLAVIPPEHCALIPPNQLQISAVDLENAAIVECMLLTSPDTLSKLPEILHWQLPTPMCARLGVPQARALSGGSCELLRADCVAAMTDDALRAFRCRVSRPFSAVRDLTLRQATLFLGNYDAPTLIYLWNRFGNAIAFGPHQLTLEQLYYAHAHSTVPREFLASFPMEDLSLVLAPAATEPPQLPTTLPPRPSTIPQRPSTLRPKSAGGDFSQGFAALRANALRPLKQKKTADSLALQAAGAQGAAAVDLTRVTWLTVALLADHPINHAFLERHLVELVEHSMEGVRAEHIRGLSPRVFTMLQRASLERLPFGAIGALSAEQMAAIPQSVEFALVSRFTAVQPSVIPTMGDRFIHILLHQLPDAAAGTNTLTCKQFTAATAEQKKTLLDLFRQQSMRERTLYSYFKERCDFTEAELERVQPAPGRAVAPAEPKGGLSAAQGTGIGLGAVGAAAVVVYALKRRHNARRKAFEVGSGGVTDGDSGSTSADAHYVSLDAGAS